MPPFLEYWESDDPLTAQTTPQSLDDHERNPLDTHPLSLVGDERIHSVVISDDEDLDDLASRGVTDEEAIGTALVAPLTDDFLDLVTSDGTEDADYLPNGRSGRQSTAAKSVILDQDRVGDVVDETGTPIGALLPASHSIDASKSFAVVLPSSTLNAPRYHYDGHEPPAPESSERKAIEAILDARPLDDSGFVEIDLDHFAVYISNKNYECDMRTLEDSWKLNYSCMYVDGVLSYKDRQFFVRRIPFRQLPIGNYGIEEHTVGDQIWIRSKFNESGSTQDVYYKLKRPSKEYVRFHGNFVWVADLAKHVVDYVAAMDVQGRSVEFKHFKAEFHDWLLATHGHSKTFRQWLAQYPSKDFKIAVNAHIHFIHKEAFGVLGPQVVEKHRLWSEIRDWTAYKASGGVRHEKYGPTVGGIDIKSDTTTTKIPPTVVTPYIYDCFSHMPFASTMVKTTPSQRTEKLRQTVIEKQHLESQPKSHDSAISLEKVTKSDSQRKVQVGDVISTPRDDESEGGKWRKGIASDFNDIDRWFGLVQKIHVNEHGKHSYDVTWMYRPDETICGAMKYPWNNELFLSDHCSCGDKMAKIQEDQVLGTHVINWQGSASESELFCRQTYLHAERQWITFRPDHLICSHRKPPKAETYQVGDTVLVHLQKNTQRLEPCEILEFQLGKKGNRVSIRPLLRRQQVEPGAATKARPNELVYPGLEGDRECLRDDIHARCNVRHFRPEEDILTPYDRDGVGNMFYIRTWLAASDGKRSCQQFDDHNPFPTSLRQGFDPAGNFRALKGFDLFCGGGNFGRGLEEAGAIEMKWANDISPRAIHSYMANVDSDDVHPFLGSIDDLQQLALDGRFSDNVPPVGEVEFVSGGSPCPGFSRLTTDKTTPEQRKNQSLVASFASFIDLYRPKYGLLENVVEIVQSKKDRTQDVFSQLICAIVGMGYQAHFSLLDAWTYGSPQSRSRVFLVFAAPGYRLPQVPMQTHLSNDLRLKSLGYLPNGESMVVRQFYPTAFGPLSAAEALADLPEIGDAKADCCIPFPDHRHCVGVTKKVRAQFYTMPNRPFNLNYNKACKMGLMTEAERNVFPKGRRTGILSKAYGRVHPKKIMNTVTTTASPTDAFVGHWLHWYQNRVLTVMEARRAQGFRDHEIIVGEPRLQWATIGNSVAREVSLALGLSFREAWLGSLVNGDEILPPKVRHVVTQTITVQETTTTTRNVAVQRVSVQDAVMPDVAVQNIPAPAPVAVEARSPSKAQPLPAIPTTTTDVIDIQADEEVIDPFIPGDVEVQEDLMDLHSTTTTTMSQDWCGRLVPDEDYVPPGSGYESSSSIGTRSSSQSTTRRSAMTTPATEHSGNGQRAGDYLSRPALSESPEPLAGRKRQRSSSVMVQLFANKMAKTGENTGVRTSSNLVEREVDMA